MKKTLTWKAKKKTGTMQKPTWWEHFVEHHDTMKYMDTNKAHLRRNFPRGHVHIIEDYAENGELGKMKKEHGSRYFDSRLENDFIAEKA